MTDTNMDECRIGGDHDWFVANLKHYRWRELFEELGSPSYKVLHICNVHKCNTWKLEKKIWTGRLRTRPEKRKDNK